MLLSAANAQQESVFQETLSEPYTIFVHFWGIFEAFLFQDNAILEEKPCNYQPVQLNQRCIDCTKKNFDQLSSYFKHEH